MYVNIGAPSNACQSEDRVAEVPGQDPCPLLERARRRLEVRREHAGPDPGFRHAIRDGYAAELRHGLRHQTAGGLYLVQHGRDQLDTLWPGTFTTEQNAELPSEEFLKVDEGSNFGWPYCFHDWQQGKRLLQPEYGGDGKIVGRCAQYPPPIVAFPGHWAPNDLHFYNGRQFPEKYRGGAFIVFHGSWNRAPLPQVAITSPSCSSPATNRRPVTTRFSRLVSPGERRSWIATTLCTGPLGWRRDRMAASTFRTIRRVASGV